MENKKGKTRFAGILLIVGMIAGIFSVAPAVDSKDYLTEAAENPNQIVLASMFQFIMMLAYAGFAILLFPLIKKFGQSLSVGFLSFRMIAAALVVLGTALLMTILALSQQYVAHSSGDSVGLEVLGNTLKLSRDYVNHVFMILTLCTGNVLLYVLFLRSGLVPRWISIWGISGAILAMFASVLVLFHAVEIIAPEYLALNAPTALLDLILGIWLIVKGFNSSLSEPGRGKD